MKKYLLEIARDAIEEELTGKKVLDEDALVKAHPELREKWATFVTLKKKKNKKLRGCIGTLVSHRTLLEDVISNAKSAAFRDPRFHALKSGELEKLSVEVSLLTEPKELVYKDIADLRTKIKVGIDGVVLKSAAKQATFLPQVWEQLEDFDQFFLHLCQKASLKDTCLKLHPEIFTYQVEKIEE